MSIEWPLVFFTLFVGLGCGTFVASVLVTEWWGREEQVKVRSAVLALIALAVGGVSSVLHLGHPERIFGALGHPTSGIFLESTLIGLVGLDIIIYLIALRRQAGAGTRRVITIIGAVLAVILAFAVGDSYVVASRPAWDTLILPFLYLVSAGVMGCFSLNALIAGNRKFRAAASRKARMASAGLTATTDQTAVTGETAEAGGPAEAGETAVNLALPASLNRTALVILALQAVLLIAYLVHLAVVPNPDITRSATRALTGNLAPLFWIGLVLPGFLLPAALILQNLWKKSKDAKGTKGLPSLALVNLGLGCVLIGGVAFRVLIFSLGSSVMKFF